MNEKIIIMHFQIYDQKTFYLGYRYTVILQHGTKLQWSLSLSLSLSHTHTHTHTRIQTVLYILSYHNKSDQTKRILTKEVNMQTHPLLYIYSIQIKVSTATVKKKALV